MEMGTIEGCIEALNIYNWKNNDDILNIVTDKCKNIVSSSFDTKGIFVWCTFTIINTKRSSRNPNPHIFNTKKIQVQNITFKDFITQNINDTIQVFQGLMFEYNAQSLRQPNEDIVGAYNTLFVEISKQFTSVVSNENDYNTFINDQLANIDSGVKIITLSKNMYYIFLTTLHIYDALHDYKAARTINFNAPRNTFDIDIFKGLLETQKTKLDREYKIPENGGDEISQPLVTAFNDLFNSTDIEPAIKAFSSALLNENRITTGEETPASFYDKAKKDFDAETKKLQNSEGDKDVHHIISNAPSRYKYDNELPEIRFSPNSTINNNCFANMGTFIDGSNAGMCGSIQHMLKYGRLNLEIGESNIKLQCDDMNYIQYNSKIFTFKDKIYSSLIVKRVVNNRQYQYHAHYVYKLLDKQTQASDVITVSSQSSDSKYKGEDTYTYFLFKYCPPFMGEFVRANETNIIDNTYNKDRNLSIIFNYNGNRRDIIHYAWKSLCDFTQYWLTILNKEGTYTKSYIEGNIHPLVVIHGDQPAHSLNEIVLRFCNTNPPTNKNTLMHTVLALQNCLKISNIAGIVTYIDLRILKTNEIRKQNRQNKIRYKAQSSSIAKISAKRSSKINKQNKKQFNNQQNKPLLQSKSVLFPKANLNDENSRKTQKRKRSLISREPNPTYQNQTISSRTRRKKSRSSRSNGLRRSLRLRIKQQELGSRKVKGGSIIRYNIPTKTKSNDIPSFLKNTNSLISTPVATKSVIQPVLTVKRDQLLFDNKLYEKSDVIPLSEPIIESDDEIDIVNNIIEIFLDPDIVNNILNFKYTSIQILHYNAFLFTMYIKNKDTDTGQDFIDTYLPDDFSSRKLFLLEPEKIPNGIDYVNNIIAMFNYDVDVHKFLNNVENAEIYNELVTIYTTLIDKNI
jgi:hypothetical protein